jgi:hypothetical protein
MKKLLALLLLSTPAFALTQSELAELSACNMVNNANPSPRCIDLQVRKLQENYVPEPKPGDVNWFGVPPGWETEMAISNTINGLLEQTQKLEPRLKKIERRLKKLERR